MGFDEDEAKSLAVTRAKLGAAAKAGYLGSGKTAKHFHAPSRSEASPERPPIEVDQIHFAGMRPYIAILPKGVRGLMHSKGTAKIIAPEEYDKSTVAKLEQAYPAGYSKVLEILEQLAEAVGDPARLNSEAYTLWTRFAPMAQDENGKERKPRFGERCIFKAEKVYRLIEELQS
jgi:hypothetical protein